MDQILGQKKLYIPISKIKAELSFFVVFGVLSIVFSMFNVDHFGWIALPITLGSIFIISFFVWKKYKGEYFVEMDYKGIRWRQHIFSKFINIPWAYLQRVDYLEFEINFMLKETAQVVCLQLSNFTENEAEQIKQHISDVLVDLRLYEKKEE